MKKSINQKQLFLSASIIALSFISLPNSAEAGGRLTCYFEPPECVDFNGNTVPINVCYDPRAGAGIRPPHPSGNCNRPAPPLSTGGSWGCPRRGRVICTHFFQKGEISEEDYFGDTYFTLKHLPKAVVRGYHYWAIPYVKHMRKNSGGIAERIIRPLALHRAYELSYQIGMREKPNYFGKVIRFALEPLCHLVGLFVNEQDYSVLYTSMAQNMLDDKFDAFMLQKQASEVVKSYNDYTAALAV